MKRVFAGVFGRDADSALGVSSSGFSSPRLSVRWTGPAPSAGRHTVLLAGRLLNVSDLAADLAIPPDEPERLVSLAFDRWGRDALSRLRGSFALLVWDAETGSGLLAVDQLGAGGIFLHESNGALAFATEVRELLRALPGRPAPDPDSLAQWVTDGQLARGTTLYEGVRRLEGGHAVRLEGGRWHPEAYWAPRFAARSPKGREDAVAELRSALTRSVAACSGEARTVAVQLSGGLDSSLLAGLARELAPSVIAYSVVHPQHPEIDESAWIERVAGALDVPSERLSFSAHGVLATALEYEVAWELPPATAMLAFTEPLLRRAASDGVAVLLDGEGGDELLGCSEYVVADRLRRLDVRGAVSLARRLPGAGEEPDARFLWALVREYGLRGAAPHGLHRLTRRMRGPGRHAPWWLRPAVAKRRAELRDDWAWKQLDGPRSWSYLADLLTAGRERMGAFDLLRHEYALAGVAGAHPLLEDLDLVELVLRLPPELALDPLRTRPLAREAMAGLLPDDVRFRQDKVDFSALVVEALTGTDRPLLETILGAPDAEVRAYVRPGALTTLLEMPSERRSSSWARVVARLALLEAWLRAQSDPGFPQRLLGR